MLNSLFRKYIVALVALVTGTLLISGITEIYFSHQEHKTALLRVEQEKALAAAWKIEQFTREVEREVVMLARSPWSSRAMPAAERQFEYRRTLGRAHAISEITRIDSAGREQLTVSRLALDAIGRKTDRSDDPIFRAAKAGRTYFSPVYFRMESEPYMTVAVSSLDAGVVLAEVNLKHMWEAVSDIAVGRGGYAYAVDSNGRLIAHPDISLVLQNTDLSSLAHVHAARTALSEPEKAPEKVAISRALDGREVLTAHAAIPSLGWLVFVEQPVEETLAPLHVAAARGAAVLLLGLVLAVLMSVLLARRMVAPIRELQQGAARVGAGEFGYRISVRTGDELETLAAEFNRTAERLKDSHASLEGKVEARTRELAGANAELVEALEQQTAISEVLRVFSGSPGEVQPVFDLIAASSARLCQAKFCAVFRAEGDHIHFVAAHGPDAEQLERVRQLFPVRKSPDTAVGRAIQGGRVVAIPDVEADAKYTFAHAVREIGGRSVVAVPMLRQGEATGAVVVGLSESGAFPEKQVRLLQTFADQAVIAIEHARLFRELADKNRYIERDLEFARAIQLSMVPANGADKALPSALSVGAALQPAREIGGDLYDYFPVGPGRLCLVVADVSDKGASAALFMARTRSTIRLLAAQWAQGADPLPSPSQLMEDINTELCQDNPHAMFVTLFIAVADAASGEVSWCSAGHLPPYRVGRDGGADVVAGGESMPVGLQREFVASAGTLKLAPGESLFLYTDGITEAANAEGAMFGASRLAETLAACTGLAPRAMVERVLREVRAFTATASPSDDIAALACRWAP
ncbi:MAG: SpoIIE family protein phosphatase [Betaproteobacteria bacterium]